MERDITTGEQSGNVRPVGGSLLGLEFKRVTRPRPPRRAPRSDRSEIDIKEAVKAVAAALLLNKGT